MYINIVSQLQEIPNTMHLPVSTKKTMLKYSHYNGVRVPHSISSGGTKDFSLHNLQGKLFAVIIKEMQKSHSFASRY